VPNADGSLTPGEIAEAASKPQSVSVDGTSATRASTQELIEADRHRAANAGAATPWRGLIFAKIRKGSAVNGDRG
jgi:hypothetical protein